MISLRKPLLVAVTAVILLATFGFVEQPVTPANGNQVFSLRAPAFLSVARAQENSIASVISDEAGISAYFDAATTIDLNNVRDAFRTIEEETAEYIIGSVEVTDYPESEDVHVYVHVDGWILAYYLAADPTAKICDWIDYHDSGQTDLTTKIENTLIKVASYAVVPYPGCTYYDFRYPNATHLMIIADGVYQTTDEFEVNLPGSFTFYERSWSIGSNSSSSYTLDGVVLNSSSGWQGRQGTLTAAQLLPAQFHTVSVWAYHYAGSYGYGGLVLIFRES